VRTLVCLHLWLGDGCLRRPVPCTRHQRSPQRGLFGSRSLPHILKSQCPSAFAIEMSTYREFVPQETAPRLLNQQGFASPLRLPPHLRGHSPHPNLRLSARSRPALRRCVRAVPRE
jgi:hypothetical protein